MGLHFLAFWLCGLHFLAFWPFRGQLLGPPPTSCQKWPVCPTSLQWIYQRQDRLHFAVFSLLGLYFLAFWPCRPSFPCILALWAFISLHFGLVGLHFLAFWPCELSFPCILALWAFISLHLGLAGLHFLLFWLFRGPLLGSSPQVAKNGLFAQRPYNGFISAVARSILQFLAFWAFISLHFGLVGFHFLAFWPRGPSSLHFCLFGVLPTSCQKLPVCPTSLQWIYQRRDRLHFAVFSLLGLYFLAFWHCGPSFPCILALWAPCGPSFPCILAL